MGSERLAVAWVLVIILGLLLGLLIVVLAFGVVRHLRRQRPKSERPRGRSSSSHEDGDEPAEWRRPGRGGNSDD